MDKLSPEIRSAPPLHFLSWMNIMDNFLRLITEHSPLLVYPALLYIYLSTFLFWYWVAKGRKDLTIYTSTDKYYYVFLGSLCGMGIFFYGGFSNFLFFIPSSWGQINTEGNNIGFKIYISMFLAIVSTLFIHSRPFKFIQAFKGKED